jgi:hypothetical protein
LFKGLSFGKKYIWRYGAVEKGGKTLWSAPIHFEISPIPGWQMAQTRLRIIISKARHINKGIILVDHLRAACDFSGTPVWFLPLHPHFGHPMMINDLRLNKRGMITCMLDGRQDMECDLQGKTKWAYPNISPDDTFISSKIYHHDFQHLPNGDYMLMTNDKRWVKIPSNVDIKAIIAQNPTVPTITSGKAPAKVYVFKSGLKIRKNPQADVYEAQIEYGAVLELDTNYKTVWQWDSEDYLNKTGVFRSGNNNKAPYIEWDPHLNAFCSDDSNKFVYASFRNLSRIVKIDKRTDKVVNSWGTKMDGGEVESGNDFFHLQHGVTLTPDKNILVYDNEDTLKTKHSGVVIFTDPKRGDTSKIIWNYVCNFDSGPDISPRGGNVDFLPNGDYLVCMGGIPRIFELIADKRIVWSAILEKDSAHAHVSGRPYRAHYASSLYPCYFSVSLSSEFLNRSDKTFPVKIFNKGSEDDSYIINVTCGSGLSRTLNTPIVRSGKSATFETSCFKNLSAGDQVVIKITSRTNPDFQRTKLLSYKR